MLHLCSLLLNTFNNLVLCYLGTPFQFLQSWPFGFTMILGRYGSSHVHISWLAANVPGLCVSVTGFPSRRLATPVVFRNYCPGFHCRICYYHRDKHRSCPLVCGIIATQHKYW